VADSSDSELWDNVDTSKLRAVFLTMTEVQSNLNVLEELKRVKHKTFKVYAYCKYDDVKEKYLKNGADFVFDYKTHLGKAYVEQALMQAQFE
jgi:hypothetical protein